MTPEPADSSPSVICSVLQVVTSTKRRGAETFALDLGRRLATLTGPVTTLALEASAVTHPLPIRALGRHRYDPRGLQSLHSEVRNHDITVAHGSATLLACVLATDAGRRPFVYRVIGDPSYWTSTWGRRTRVGALLRKTAGIAVYYPGAAEALQERYGLPADRIRVIPKGVDLTRFPVVSADERRAARERLGADGRPVVVALGALNPEKNVDQALEAVRPLPDCLLVLVGDGPERVRLERAARSRPGQVCFLGDTPDPRRWLAAADALVLPSLTEGVPGAVIEAGLCGVGAVANDVGGVREAVRDGVTGRVVPAGDAAATAAALGEVLAEPRRFGVAAREHCVNQFDIERVAGRWAEYLRGLARPSRVEP